MIKQKVSNLKKLHEQKMRRNETLERVKNKHKNGYELKTNSKKILLENVNI